MVKFMFIDYVCDINKKLCGEDNVRDLDILNIISKYYDFALNDENNFLCSSMKVAALIKLFQPFHDGNHRTAIILFSDLLNSKGYEFDLNSALLDMMEHKLKIGCIGLGSRGRELFRLLDHNEADIVCTLDSHIYNSNYIIAWEEKIGVHLVAAADHPLAEQNMITKEVLLSQELLLTEKNMSYRRLLDDFLAKDSLAVEPMLENGDADLLCLLVCQGLGISFLPDYVTEEAVRQGKIVRLDLDGFHPELWKQLLYRRDKWVSPPMQAALTELSKITDKPGS